MKDLCSGPVFNRLLRRKTVDLSRERLESLIGLARGEELGGLVRELNIRVPHYGTPCLGFLKDVMLQDITEDDIKFVEDQQQIQDKTSCLASLISAFKLLRRLDWIDVNLVVIMGVGLKVFDEPDWWQWDDHIGISYRVYGLVMSVIARSGIPVKALSIYQQNHVFCVSLAGFTVLTDQLERYGFKIPGSEIKDFAIKIGPHIPNHVDLSIWTGNDSPPDRDTLGLVRLLMQMKKLEDLQLDVFTNELNKYCSEKVFPAVASLLHWPYLRRCTLGGIYTDEASLLNF